MPAPANMKINCDEKSGKNTWFFKSGVFSTGFPYKLLKHFRFAIFHDILIFCIYLKIPIIIPII